MAVSPIHRLSTRDVWTKAINGLREHVEVVAFDAVPRFEMASEFCVWTEEQGREIPRGWAANVQAYEPVFAAAHIHQADAVLFVCPKFVPASILNILRADGFKVWGWFTESPYEDAQTVPSARFFDACFVNDRNSVERFREVNPNSHYLAHCYDEQTHYPPEGPVSGDRVIYVGTPFSKRREFLEAVDWSGVNLYLRAFWSAADGACFADYTEDEWNADTQALKPYIDPWPVMNIDAAQLYRESVIGLSMHRTETYLHAPELVAPDAAYSLGPRSYELAACGLFQISDYRTELTDVFGDTVPVFRTPLEMRGLVSRYLADPVRRQDLARQQWEAVRPHSSKARVAQLLEMAG